MQLGERESPRIGLVAKVCLSHRRHLLFLHVLFFTQQVVPACPGTLNDLDSVRTHPRVLLSVEFTIFLQLQILYIVRLSVLHWEEGHLELFNRPEIVLFLFGAFSRRVNSELFWSVYLGEPFL